MQSKSHWRVHVRLGYSITSYPPAVGGAQLHAHMLARELAQGDDVRVASLWSEHRTDWLRGTTILAPGTTRHYSVNGIPVTQMGLSATERRRLALPALAYLIAQPWAVAAIARTILPHLRQALPDGDLIHNFRIGRKPLSYASMLLARERGVPFVLTPFHHPRWGGWLHRGYHQLYREADSVFALTHAERDILIGLGVAEDRIAVIGHGPVLADEPRGERFRQRYGIEGPIVLYLGQKFAYKGLAVLLDATTRVWERAAEVRFVFLGPRTRYSQGLFADRHDSRILELDTVSLEEKTDALAACSMLCVPSGQESFGGVYAEAWALGKPVIAADTPATRELIGDGQDGLLVTQDARAVAAAIALLLEDPARAISLGEHGRAKVERHYRWPRIAERARAAYIGVLARATGARV